MDGTAVNQALLKTLSKERDNQQLPKLVNIGSCNLHVLHGAFQKGAETTGWKMKRLLKHLHFLFYNAGARRGHFIKVTGSQQFPFSFCNVRWLESKAVAKRAVNLWQNVEKIVFYWEK